MTSYEFEIIIRGISLCYQDKTIQNNIMYGNWVNEANKYIKSLNEALGKEEQVKAPDIKPGEKK